MAEVVEIFQCEDENEAQHQNEESYPGKCWVSQVFFNNFNFFFKLGKCLCQLLVAG